MKTVIYLNAIGAFIAFAANIYAALDLKGWIRYIFSLTATLALVYFASFVWLATNLDRAAEWSETMRPIAIVAWIVAWTIEPLYISYYIKKKAKEIKHQAQNTVAKYE